MPRYSIELKRSAKKELERAPKPIAGRLIDAIDALASEPRPEGARKLRGVEHTYRLRVANWRVVYQIHDERVLVIVVRVRHRKDAYRD